MKNKYLPEVQAEINEVLNEIQEWKRIFEFKIEFFYDGWAVFLREKNTYPRFITIFKSYNRKSFSIKSFEISLKNFQKEEFKFLYSNEDIGNINELIQELKDVIYGKDLIKGASNIYKSSFLKG